MEVGKRSVCYSERWTGPSFYTLLTEGVFVWTISQKSKDKKIMTR